MVCTNEHRLRLLMAVAMESVKFLIFLFPLLCQVANSQGSYFDCRNSGGTYKTNGKFGKNLNDLLAVLKNSASLTGFSNGTAGRSPNQAYGLMQCGRGVSAQDCRTCAASAAVQILQDCPNKRIALEWFDNCILRYSMVDFFGAVDFNQLALVNTVSMPNLSEFRPFVASFLNNLTLSATNDPQNFFYATGSVKYTGNTTLYGLAECTRDLSPSSCDACLKATTKSIMQCCSDRQGARILTGSCRVRYEIYPFGTILSKVKRNLENDPK